MKENKVSYCRLMLNITADSTGLEPGVVEFGPFDSLIKLVIQYNRDYY